MRSKLLLFTDHTIHLGPKDSWIIWFSNLGPSKNPLLTSLSINLSTISGYVIAERRFLHSLIVTSVSDIKVSNPKVNPLHKLLTNFLSGCFASSSFNISTLTGVYTRGKSGFTDERSSHLRMVPLEVFCLGVLDFLFGHMLDPCCVE